MMLIWIWKFSVLLFEVARYVWQHSLPPQRHPPTPKSSSATLTFFNRFIIPIIIKAHMSNFEEEIIC